MRVSAVIVLFLFFSNVVTAQQTEPFIIKGQLTNCSKKEFLFFFSDPQQGYKDYYKEVVKIDSTGRFYLKTFALIKPAFVTLRAEELSLDFYAAPGYDLTVTGDVSDIKLFQQHKKIEGIGAGANKYLMKMDSIAYASSNNTRWYEMKNRELLQFIQKDQKQSDSIRSLVFNIKTPPDKWFNDFGNIARLNSKSMQLYYLISEVIMDTTLSASFVNENFDKTMLADLYNEKYLVADSYRGWLMGTYPEYLRTLAIRKDPAHKNINYDTDIFQQIANNYKGKIREIKLYDKINKTIFYCRSFEELNLYKEMLPAYIALLHDKKDVEALTAALANMETTLMSAQIGQPAPVFTIADSTGVEYSLEQYKGKVIYLDLWASWCGPCRAEAVPFKKLVEKYKDNENVAFISIAVIDKVDKWKEALIADKPTWLQLFDKNDVVKKAYFANSIPKFILIDKKGNIVSFDAPMPSSGDEIEKLINRQLVN